MTLTWSLARKIAWGKHPEKTKNRRCENIITRDYTPVDGEWPKKLQLMCFWKTWWRHIILLTWMVWYHVTWTSAHTSWCVKNHCMELLCMVPYHCSKHRSGMGYHDSSKIRHGLSCLLWDLSTNVCWLPLSIVHRCLPTITFHWIFMLIEVFWQLFTAPFSHKTGNH
jgi:hypothetical protein